jgi:hypothetical protein
MDKSIIPAAIASLIALIMISGCVTDGGEESTTSTPKVNSLEISDKAFTLEELFELCEQKNQDKHSGIALDCVVEKAGIENPKEHTYTIIASDNYRKTVKWEDMQKGILTNESVAIFPHLPKMYWIRDMVEVRESG